MASKAPIIERIPAEIHAEAQALGFIVETYTQVMAGHGVTGLVAWSVSMTRVTQDVWTDSIGIRSGVAMSSVYAHADLREALAQLKSEMS